MSKSKSSFERSTALIVMVVVFALLLVVLASVSGTMSFRGYVSSVGVQITDDSDEGYFASAFPAPEMPEGLGGSHREIFYEGAGAPPIALLSGMVGHADHVCEVVVTWPDGDFTSALNVITFVQPAGDLFPYIASVRSVDQSVALSSTAEYYFDGAPWRSVGTVSMPFQRDSLMFVGLMPSYGTGPSTVAVDAAGVYCVPA